MARALRIQEEGAVYHVMSRGNLKQDIFANENDMAYFIKILRKGAEKYKIHIFAYCLMRNHYHLSLRISTPNLPEFMHFLGSSYANYLVRGGWVGHVFSGRYKAIRVDEEEYFLIVNRYIHLNPVEAGIVGKPEEYKWSNYGNCINGRSERWLKLDWLVQYFGPGEEASREGYRRFVEEAMGMESYYPESKIVAQALLGSDEFVKRIKASLRGKCWAREVIGKQELSRIVTLEEVNDAVCNYLGFRDLEYGDFRGDNEYRYACCLLIYLARKNTAATFYEIAGVFGEIKPNAASHRLCSLKKRISENNELRERLASDEKRILKMIEG
jgi:putative transposase